MAVIYKTVKATKDGRFWSCCYEPNISGSTEYFVGKYNKRKEGFGPLACTEDLRLALDYAGEQTNNEKVFECEIIESKDKELWVVINGKNFTDKFGGYSS